MATQPPPIEREVPPEASLSRSKVLKYDLFIEQQLKKTRSHVRTVDIASGVMVLLAFTLGYVLLAGLVDHWLIGGGLGFWGRLLLWLVYVGAAGYWIVTQIVPLLVKRINPLYAAETIERSRPTLKNTLLNFLLFRDDPRGVHQRVLGAIEEQAATNLAGVHVESAVDRTRLIRLGYVLVGILVVCAAYTLLSPKDLFKTARRVAMPWADISPPTQTTIDEITPGDAEAFRGQQVEVRAHVDGLPEDGRVVLYYTTADRQQVDRELEMFRPADDYRHAAVLPARDAALEQTLSYRIEAGDAITKTYQIEVAAAPTIVVTAVEYEYPKYTGLVSQRLEHQGDIKAIEGTRVTLETVANQNIDTAHIDFDCDNKLDLRMQIQEQTASGTFTLALAEDRLTPWHESYQVTFKNTSGERNPQPVRHRISVTRDIAPEIQFVAPRADEIELPADGVVDLEIAASDPDFALASVVLSAVKGQEKIVEQPLLKENWRGQFVTKYRFAPSKLGLKAGDLVDYWALAADNKDPNPNRTQTSRRRIRIVSPTNRQPEPDQLAKNDRRDEQQRERQPGDDPAGGDNDHPRDADPPPEDKVNRSPADEPAQTSADQQEGDSQTEGAGAGDDAQPSEPREAADGQGQRSGGQQQTGSEASQDPQDTDPGVANDGTNDGEAIERILEHQKQQQQQPEPGERGSQADEKPNQTQQDGGQQGASDSSDASEKQPGAGEEGQGEERKKRQQQAEPEDAGAQQGSGASEGGQGSESAQKQPGGQQQQREGGQRSEESGQSGTRQTGEPDEANRGQPGESTSQDETGGQGAPSQEKPQRGNNTGSKQPSGTKDQQSSGEEGQGQTEEQSSDGSQSAQSRDTERHRGEGSDPQNAERRGDGKPNKPDPNRQSTSDNNTREDGTPQDPSTKGQGAASNEDPLRNPDEKPPQRDAQKPEARGGSGEDSKGDSGGGQKTEDNAGSPKPRESRPTKKSAEPSPDDEEQQPEGEAQSGNQSERESETESEQDGEHSGGGRRGGGQKANQPGTGGAGQNTAADEGAGRSDDAGDGETSDRAGGDRQSDGKTGQSGSKTGPGSQTKPSDGNSEKSGGRSDPRDQSDSPSGRNAPGKGAQGGETPSDSRPGPSNPQDRQWKPGEDKADEANLDYARKATDLALEHLRDQLRKDQPDQELLDKLGWSRSDLEKFVKRWETMRAGAQAPGNQGTTGRRELDDTLRSLGLRPRSTALKSNAARNDRVQGYKEAARTQPPAEYLESFKAYTQGTARGGK